MGRLQRIPVAGGEPQAIDTGFATRCNNDHGISPDGATLVISDQSQPDRKSRIYTLPIGGGTPEASHRNGPVVLARLVARWSHARVLRGAQRRVRHLHHPRRRRRGDPPHHRERTR
jgi:hypothetical protein